MLTKRAFILSLASLAGTLALPSVRAQQSALESAYEIKGALVRPESLPQFVGLKNAYKLPKMEFYTLDGLPVDLSEYKGKVLILNVWASWCAPCIKETPSLIKLQEKLKDSNVQVIGLSVDEKPGQLPAFLKSRGLDKFLTWADPTQEIDKVLPLSVVPTNYVLDGQGNIVGLFKGYVQWDAPDILPFLEALGKKFASPK